MTAPENSRYLPEISTRAEDVALLLGETARCGDILAELAHNLAGDDAPFSSEPIGIGNLVQNGAQFSRQCVDIRAR